MLITTLYRDEHGALQRRTDRGSNRRVLTRETEQELAPGSHIVGVIIINDDPLPDRTPLRAL